MMGRRRVIKPFIKATLQEAVRKKPGKVNFLRVGLELRDGRYFVKPSGDQHTGILRTMLRADAIALLPSERTEFAPGEELEAHLLGTDAVMLEG
jgi:molybdopterin molybdotransferase